MVVVYFEYQAIKNIEIEIIYRLYTTADFLFIGFLCIEKQSSKLYKLLQTAQSCIIWPNGKISNIKIVFERKDFFSCFTVFCVWYKT